MIIPVIAFFFLHFMYNITYKDTQTYISITKTVYYPFIGGEGSTGGRETGGTLGIFRGGMDKGGAVGIFRGGNGGKGNVGIGNGGVGNGNGNGKSGN